MAGTAMRSPSWATLETVVSLKWSVNLHWKYGETWWLHLQASQTAMFNRFKLLYTCVIHHLDEGLQMVVRMHALKRRKKPEVGKGKGKDTNIVKENDMWFLSFHVISCCSWELISIFSTIAQSRKHFPSKLANCTASHLPVPTLLRTLGVSFLLKWHWIPLQASRFWRA